MNPVRNLYICVAILVGLLFVGTSGYVVIEGWSTLDALYMTVMTKHSNEHLFHSGGSHFVWFNY